MRVPLKRGRCQPPVPLAGRGLTRHAGAGRASARGHDASFDGDVTADDDCLDPWGCPAGLIRLGDQGRVEHHEVGDAADVDQGAG